MRGAQGRRDRREVTVEVEDPRVDDVRILRPQEIPVYVAEGLFDIGITGRDWIEETASDVVSLGELKYSKATSDPIKMVLAVAGDSPVQSVAELHDGVRVTSEYPEITRRYFAKHGIDADVRLSYGASEAKVPDIADAVVEITETGRALRAAGLKVIDTILSEQLHRGDRQPRRTPPRIGEAPRTGQLMTLLNGALMPGARCSSSSTCRRRTTSPCSPCSPRRSRRPSRSSPVAGSPSRASSTSARST